MNRRIVPFSLVLAGSLLAYACSSSDDSGGTPTPGDDSGTSGGSSGTSGTSGSSGGEGGVNEGGSSSGEAGTGNPIEGIAAPAEVTGFGGATAVDVRAAFFTAGGLYFSANGTNAIVDLVPATGPFTVGTVTDPRAFGMTLDKKSSKVVIAAAAVAGGTGGGQILAFTPLATPPTADNQNAITTTALTLNWGDSGATQFDSPSDLVAKTDGTLYVSDGAFQVTDAAAQMAITKNKVWRLKPTTTAGSYDVFKTEIDGQPNGIALSTDEKTLYVTVTLPSLGGAANIVKYPVGTDGALGTQAPFANVGGATASTTSLTQLAIDSGGNIYAGYTGGVDVFKADGTKWGTIPVPAAKPVVSLAFGGADLKTLYIGCNGDLYTATVKVAGIAQ